MPKFFVWFVIMVLLTTSQVGCVGGMIMLQGKDLNFDGGITSEQLRGEFGLPIEVYEYNPPIDIAEVDCFRSYADGYANDQISHGVYAQVGKVERYSYVGPVSGWGDQAGGMVMAVEGTWTVLTLGLAQIYYIPLGIEVAQSKRDDLTEFVVAFDSSGRYLISRIIKFDPGEE